MRTETVRVVNPARPDTFMTINRADFGPGHDLWHEQAEGFVPPAAPRQNFDPAERDLAAEILNRMVPARLGISADEWAAMPGPARLDMLRRFEMDMASPAPAAGALSVTKVSGPRGLWYVMRGDQRASQGFRTEAEAQAERERMTA
jgi:hypothetical protein